MRPAALFRLTAIAIVVQIALGGLVTFGFINPLAHIDIFGEPLPALPAPQDSGPHEVTSTSAGSLRIKSLNSSSGARSAIAETQALSSSPAMGVPRRELAATAPPMATSRQRRERSRPVG